MDSIWKAKIKIMIYLYIEAKHQKLIDGDAAVTVSARLVQQVINNFHAFNHRECLFPFHKNSCSHKGSWHPTNIFIILWKILNHNFEFT